MYTYSYSDNIIKILYYVYIVQVGQYGQLSNLVKSCFPGRRHYNSTSQYLVDHAQGDVESLFSRSRVAMRSRVAIFARTLKKNN
jgi:hypothetical protein